MRGTLASLCALVLFGAGFGLLASTGAGCGSEASIVDADASTEASIVDADASTEAGACVQVGTACTSSAECCSVNCDPGTKTCGAPIGGTGICKLAGESCAVATDCCNLNCTGGKCGQTLCISDNQPCTQGSECCGTVCGPNNTCTPLNTTCKTSGNRCAANSECCSKLCQGGVCNGNPSFCTQDGDICAVDSECCGGACQKAAGASVGICGVTAAPGTTGCLSAGSVCSSATTGIGDAGAVPVCGGECCSRSCRPYGPTGVLVCQPPSGCHPTGELCQTDADCCGSSTQPQNTQNVHCSKAPGATIGRCNNGQACRAAGQVCKLATTSCNAENNCCAGNVNRDPTVCQQDILGIPRCTIVGGGCDGGTRAGQACATSADCCGMPCVPNPSGNPPLVCGSTACVPVNGACTTTADCCAGSPCIVPAGSTKGTCGPTGSGGGTDGGTIGTDGGGTLGDGSTGGGGGGGGTTCAQYGQVCTASGDCCAGLMCIEGRCGVIIR